MTEIRPQPQPMEERKKAKRDLIIESAALVFAEKGFNNSTIAEIALKAGVGKGTVYEYFRSKRELFCAVFRLYMNFMEKFADHKTHDSNMPVAQRLMVMSDSIMRYWSGRMELYTLTMEFWAASASSEAKENFKAIFKDAYRQFRMILEELIREGIVRGEFNEHMNVPAVSASLAGTLDALLLQAWFDENFDPITASADYLAVLLRGMSKLTGMND